MQYLLLIYGDERRWQDLPDDERGELYGEYGRLAEELGGRGVMLGGAELQPTATATTVRVRDGETLLADGPFAETKEQLGGFFLVEAASLDEALEVAGRIPGARWGSIEVRPVVPRGAAQPGAARQAQEAAGR